LDIATAEAILSASPEHRVLRKVTDVAAHVSASAPAPVAEERIRFGAIVDTETTGTADTDEVIELAIQLFVYDRETGQVLNASGSRSFLRQPSIPIPPEATKVHGITDADVAGKVIDPREVAERAGLHQGPALWLGPACYTTVAVLTRTL
jgi:DNA polymerase-3 subunit epsilon